MSETPVPLVRRFLPLAKGAEPPDDATAWRYIEHSSMKDWSTLASEHRVVILANAGAGKTFEMKHQAARLQSNGLRAFYLRIEDIDRDVQGALDLGTPAEYENWRDGSQGEAWFFLDSIDEAKLDSAKRFRNAVRMFARDIYLARDRAHIFLSGRPYAWTPNEDVALLDEHLPFNSCNDATGDETTNILPRAASHAPSRNDLRRGGWSVYQLAPLDRAQVRDFAVHRGTPNVDELLDAIDRSHLWSVADRPFDLDDIIETWRSVGALGSRLEMLTGGVRRRLDEIVQSRRDALPLNAEHALAGARRLAAAVTLTKRRSIQVPDGLRSSPGIDASIVLSDWAPKDVKALLSRALFSDAIYGAVRFRHREISELLTAEWLRDQIASGRARREVEGLIFRDQYGERVVTPTMLPVLPWLILHDSEIRDRALSLRPEVAVEGGDPSALPQFERRKILNAIARRIAAKEGPHTASSSDAVARIANTDLADDALALIEQHGEDDDTIVFLGKLVWQGRLAGCTPLLFPIATSVQRRLDARVACVRGILSAGTTEDAVRLWNELQTSSAAFPRAILAELVYQGRRVDKLAVRIVDALSKVETPSTFDVSGLKQRLHTFVDNSSLFECAEFACGAYKIVKNFVHVDGYDADEPQLWILGAATRAAARIVRSRHAESFDPNIVELLLVYQNVTRDYQTRDFEFAADLPDAVSSWTELNDVIYWAEVHRARTVSEASGSSYVDDWNISYRSSLWKFGIDSFDRLLGYADSASLLDDRIIALRKAHQVFVDHGRQDSWRECMSQVASRHPILAANLAQWLDATPSAAHLEFAENQITRAREADRNVEEGRLRLLEKVEWIKANLQEVRATSTETDGGITRTQSHLIQGAERTWSSFDGGRPGGWRALVSGYGQEVALAYREAALARWREYCPSLPSEGGDTTRRSDGLVFAMAGLLVEATETEGFPSGFSAGDAKHAFRYLPWSMNESPPWFEVLFVAFPDVGVNSVLAEVCFELEHSTLDNCHFTRLIFNHAKWLHKHISPGLLDWLMSNDAPYPESLHFALSILTSAELDRSKIATLAHRKATTVGGADPTVAEWYALWVASDASSAVPAARRWLDGISSPVVASHQAQLFLVALQGGRSRAVGLSVEADLSSQLLAELYILAHRFVSTEDDLERANMGLYSPELRDDAQDARELLLVQLSRLPGKATYDALKFVAQNHPSLISRQWMKQRAYLHATEDSDIDPWSDSQVYEFSAESELTPRTNHQLFSLAVSRLIDLKDWLELGSDSIADLYRLASNELMLRNAVAAWLAQHARGRYTVAQEPEQPNGQRPDLWLQRPGIPSAVPIELKLGDSDWTGPELCERLRNQLVGDYLRDAGARNGIMLLFWRGTKAERRWKVEGKLVGFADLALALERYWQTVAATYTHVDAVRVIAIDLTERGRSSTGMV